jgi:hypothetical protein
VSLGAAKICGRIRDERLCVLRESHDLKDCAPHPVAPKEFELEIRELANQIYIWPDHIPGELPFLYAGRDAFIFGAMEGYAKALAPDAHGARVHLHKNHFGPLLEVVRDAKHYAVKRRLHGRGDLFREIEHRLDTVRYTLPRDPDPC